jgi:RNA polymerase sigma factor (sigma-70 family)
MSTGIAQSSPLIVDRVNDYRGMTQQWNSLTAEELSMHIEGCALNNKASQKKIYYSFYGYAMSVCDRYTNNYDDSIEILNDGFLKIFTEIHRYRPAYTDIVGSFMGWLRKIMIYTAIDHFRKNRKYRFTRDLDDGMIQISARDADAIDNISYEEIIRSIQELTPAYRTVFNLFIIEGFTHEEISKRLSISIGTSKSNLAKARRQLQKILFQRNQIQATKSRQGFDSSKIIIAGDCPKQKRVKESPLRICI